MSAPLPEGWEWAKLEEIAHLNPKYSGHLPIEAMVSFVPMSFVEEETGKLNGQNPRPLGSLLKGYTHFEENDILFAKITPCMENGKIAIAHNLINGIGFGSTEFHVARTREVEPKYVLHYLLQKKVRRDAENSMTGSVGQKRVPSQFFSEIPLPLPPLNEQRRIVAKLEALLSELEAAVAQLQAVQAQLSTYRQAVLKAAFEGRLTAAWRAQQPALPTAAELLEQIAAARAEQAQATGKKRKPTAPLSPTERAALPELPEGWAWVQGIELGEWTGGGTPDTNTEAYWVNGDILWVSPKDMKGRLIKSTIDKITSIALEHSSAKPILPESILFVVRSGILRRVLPIAINRDTVALNQDMQALSISFGFADFIYWYFLSKEKAVRDVCSKAGTTVESIEVDRLKRFPIAFPSIEEQHQIVREIDSRLSLADQLAEAVSAGLRQAEALRQSLLQQAFSGRLVPQDPTDEPASALLARLRAAAPAPRPARGRAKTTTPQP